MANALRELLVSFGIEVDDHELRKGHEEVSEFKETLLKFGEALGVAFGLRELKEFVGGAIEAGARVGDLSERLGVGTADLQAFQYAAGLAGVDAEGAAHSLGLLNRTIGDALVGGGEAAATFAKLGVAIKGPGGAARDVNEVLLDVAGAFEKMPNQQTRAAYAMKLFGREGQALIPVLGKGREELAATLSEFQALGGGMSEDFVKSAKEIDDETKKLSVSWTGLKTTIVGALLPAIKPIVDWFKKIVVGVRDVVKHTRVLQTAFKFATALGIVVGLTKIAGGLKAIFVNGLLAEAPLAVLAAAMLLLYLAYDELDTLLKGGDTLIGDALGPEKAKFVWELREAIDTLTGAGKDLLSSISDDGSAMDGFKTIVVDTAKALAYLVEVMAAAVDGAKKIGEGVGGLIFGEGKSQEESDREGLTPQARAQLEAMHRSGTAGYAPVGFARERAIVQQIKAARDARASLPPTSGPLASTMPPYLPGGAMFQGPMPGAVGTTIQQTNHTTVTVQTSSDNPKGIGDATKSAVATAQQRANEKAYRAVRKP